MSNSYQVFSGPTVVNNSFPITQIDGYLEEGHLKVYKNNILQTSGYSFTNPGTLTLSFTTAPINSDVIKVARETPNTVAGRVVDFSDGSVLTASDLDKSALQLLYIGQEAADAGGNAVGYNTATGAFDANSLRISNVANPINQQDVVTRNYIESLQLYGTASAAPQTWEFTITTGQWTNISAGIWSSQVTLNGLLGNNVNMLIVVLGGVIQSPVSAYQLNGTTLTLYSTFQPTTTLPLTVRNFGVSRGIGSTDWNELSNKPIFGSSAYLDVPAASTNASISQVVRGDDTRLTNTRTPAAHTHPISEVTNLQTTLNSKVDTQNGVFASPPTLNTPGGGFAATNVVNKDYVDTALAAVAGAPTIILAGNQARTAESCTPGSTTNISMLSSEFDGPVGSVWHILCTVPPASGAGITSYSCSWAYATSGATGGYWYTAEVKGVGSTASPINNFLLAGNLFLFRPMTSIAGAVTATGQSINLVTINNTSAGSPNVSSQAFWAIIKRVR
jgi:hypothetical protein